jgi:hypothetical protein
MTPGVPPAQGAVMKLRQLLIYRYPLAYCDGCLARQLNVSVADATEAALTVSAEPIFARQRRTCYGCHNPVN